MKPHIKDVVAEQLETLDAQVVNAASALQSGDTTKLEKALSIMEKVARVLILVIGAVQQGKAKR